MVARPSRAYIQVVFAMRFGQALLTNRVDQLPHDVQEAHVAGRQSSSVQDLGFGQEDLLLRRAYARHPAHERRHFWAESKTQPLSQQNKTGFHLLARHLFKIRRPPAL